MIKEIFRIISIWIVVLPLVAGVINYKGLNRDSRWIFLLIIVALAPQLLTFIIDSQNKVLNISYNLYTVAEFAILYVLFYNKYHLAFYNTIFRLSLWAYLVIAGWVLVTNGFADKFLNDLVCYNNIIYTVWILFFLKEQYHLKDTVITQSNPFAWYLLALLIYAPCTIIVFALYYYIRAKANPVLMNTWIIQSVCNILLYLFFTAGLFISRKKECI